MIPGSALRKLSAITGLVASNPTKGVFRLDIEPGVALFFFGKDEKEACLSLRNDNLRRVDRSVFEAQKWKCFKCGQVKPLQGHHVIFRSRWRRSMGPLDVESNITGMCSDCHEQQHR